MFHTNRRLNLVLWVVLAGMASGCTGTSCTGCSMEPLPAGGLPASQTVEGGAQIRITGAGLDTIESLIVSMFDDLLGDGFCIGPQNLLSADIDVASASVDLCNVSSCDSGGTGCDVAVSVDQFTTEVVGNALRVGAVFDASTVIDLSGTIDTIVGNVYDDSCTIDVSLNDAAASFDIVFGVTASTGELDINFANVNQLDLTSFNMTSHCGTLIDTLVDVIDSGIDLLANVADVLTDELGFFFGPIIADVVDGVVDQLLPDPLGLAATANLSGLLQPFSPSTRPRIETKIIPGGYANIVNDGLSIGVITGFNSDRDPTTRGPGEDSEPVLCVPPIPAPDFSVAPHSLDTIARNYGNPFTLLPADEFNGDPDPAGTDVLFGASETMLDLFGHHLVNSGALCLAVSTESIAQLNLGTIGLFVPSFAELGSPDGKDPLMLVTRPVADIDFSIGEGTEGDPALVMHIKGLEIDFYAFIFERWVRGFTISLDANVGIDLQFTTDTDGNPAVLPVLSGLESENLHITVLNSDFLREPASDLESVFPSLVDLALPLIAGSLGEITLPSVSGFTLDQLTLSKVTTAEDDFLSISGGLATTQAMMQMAPLLAQRYPKLATALEAMEVPAPRKVTTQASLREVHVPSPEAIRQSLLRGSMDDLPEVVLTVPATDDQGRELEYTWNIDGGLWRPFVPGGEITLEDRAFAVQGKYDIQVRARAVGDYASIDTEAVHVPVVIDSAPPRILIDQTTSVDGTTTVPVSDLVSDVVEVAFGPVGKSQPTTDWQTGGSIDTDTLLQIAGDRGGVAVYARDEQGNQQRAVLDLGTGSTTTGGCNASSGGGMGDSVLILAGLLGLWGFGRRRRFRWVDLARTAVRSRVATAGALVAIALSPGCSCGANQLACELNEDCAGACEEGTVPLCTEDNMCLCADDVPMGRIGQYSSMAVAGSNDVYVSAYNSTHGDLMVAQWSGNGRVEDSAWEFVDGVPDGPVVLPDSTIRGGIFEPGEDVGLYTDVASRDGVAYVSYFDRTNSALKLATNVNGTWETSFVEKGAPFNSESETFKASGQYSSITLGQSGIPAIAYFYQDGQAGDGTTEVRLAVASSATPTGPSDWTITTIDQTTVTDLSTDGLTIPEGLGLFTNTTRRADDSIAIVYYDRQNGQLKLATEGDSGWDVQVLDGGDGLDVGWYPSVVEDSEGVLHVSYVDAIDNDLVYINTADMTPELVDDGYRLVGTTPDGLPKPELQFVGDDSAIVMTASGPLIAYQNATTHELLVASRTTDSAWDYESLAGGGETFTGGYGFYARAEATSSDVVMSTWVVDQPDFDAWIEIFRLSIGNG